MSNTNEEQTTKEEIKHHAVKQKSPRLRASTAVMLCFTIIALLVAGVGFYIGYRAAISSAQDGVTLGQMVKDTCAAASTSPERKQIEHLCPKAEQVVEEAPDAASPTTTPTPPVPGPSGPSGAPAPSITARQLLSIVTEYCQANTTNCRGPKVTAAEIDAAIARHCANNNCKGDSVTGSPGIPGASGSPGIPGPSGPVGPEGPPVSQERIMAGIEEYCEADASNCGREIICPSGEPTALEVRVRPSEEPEIEPQWQVIQTCV